MSAYKGKLLRVNLTSGDISVETIDESIQRQFIGGRGLGTYYLKKEVDPQVDALAPENKLIIATGPLTGSSCPTAGRYMVITKSPLSGTVASSNSGGYWGPQLKAAGYDMLILEGRAESPVYMVIDDDKVELRDATAHWGKVVSETTDALMEEAGLPKARVLMIGPAGQQMSLIASIMNDKHRAAGRSGVGAVMGSKNLLGIVCQGSGAYETAKPDELKEALKKYREMLKAHPVTGEGLPTHGTAVLVNVINGQGVYPTRNFQQAVYEDAETVSGEALTENYLTGREACYRCPIACGRKCNLDGVEVGGPEYETLWAYTADCGMNDMEAVIRANNWCNEYGIDTISAGATIACAMELFTKGYITADELDDGPPLEFGNAEAVVEWTRRLGAGIGLGKKLALGSYRLAESYGVPELSMTVKKLELPAYDPRGIQGHGLQYATSNRGGCHVRGYLISPEILGVPEAVDRTTLEGKAGLAKGFQDLTAVIDSLGMCLFSSFALGPAEYAEMYALTTGWDITEEEVWAMGDRIWNIERLFNLEAGVDPSQDKLPKRLLSDPIPEGPSKGMVHHLDQLLPEYYKVRGWSEGGIPTPEKLAELELA